MSASGLPITQLGSTIKAHLSTAEKYIGKSEGHYKAAGLHLVEAKQRIEAGEYEGRFGKFLTLECNSLSSSRAYELIAIANGTKTVESIRAAVNERAARARSPMPSESDEPQADQALSKNKPANSPVKRGRPAAPKTQHEVLTSHIVKACKGLSVAELQAFLGCLRERDAGAARRWAGR